MGLEEGNNSKVDQLLKGVFRLCSDQESCEKCPFYTDDCVFGTPKPKTWFRALLTREPRIDDSVLRVMEEPKEEPKAVEPEIEVPIFGDPVVEEPKVAEPVVEEPVVEEPKGVEPIVEQPKVEQPKVEEVKIEEPKAEAPKVEEPKVEEPKAEKKQVIDDSIGTWLVSTTMGSVLSKYVFICSKCGYKKESYFSIPPTDYCPECSKNKA